VANFRIWAPWRLAYVKDASKDNEEECIFCAKPAAEDDEANLIVHRGESSFVILNLFPYTNGHLMVAPYEHIGRLQEIPAETLAEMMALAQRAMARLEEVYEPHGYNVGFNQGRVAGAGFEHHIHLHVVPRWGGDTNFMPVIADTKVMPQSLEQSYDALAGAFEPWDIQGVRHSGHLRLRDGRVDGALYRARLRPRLGSPARQGAG
jgi:ATP adenylyltransferase